MAETTFHDPEQRVLAILTSGLIELQPYSGLIFVGWLLLASLFLFSSLMMPARRAAILVDNKDSANNQPGLIGFEIESQPCKISVRDIWLRSFD